MGQDLGNKVIARDYVDKNYISKTKLLEELNEIKRWNFNDYTNNQDGNEIKYEILIALEQRLLGE